MKKIAFYIYSLNKGGAERVLLELMENLKEVYDIVLITDAVDEREYPMPANIRRIVISELMQSHTGKHGGTINRLLQLRKLIKKEKPDLVIAFMIQNGMRALMAQLFTSQKTVVAIRSNPKIDCPTKISWARMNGLLSRAARVICQTEYQAQLFDKAVQKKIDIIANPVKDDYPYALPLEERKPKIVSVGRLFDYKNHKMLIKAFRLIHGDFPQYELFIYGEGPYRTELEKCISQYGLEEYIHLWGDVTDVASYIQDAELFVLPSDTEGLPNALMEAMEMGIAVIATDCPCGGPKSLITTGVNGYLCNVDDEEQLAQIMSRLLGDRKELERLGTEAIKIRRTHCKDTIIDQWCKVIESI